MKRQGVQIEKNWARKIGENWVCLTGNEAVWREWENWPVKLAEKKTGFEPVQKRHGGVVGEKTA